jgi:hypothetical protein
MGFTLEFLKNVQRSGPCPTILTWNFFHPLPLTACDVFCNQLAIFSAPFLLKSIQHANFIA